MKQVLKALGLVGLVVVMSLATAACGGDEEEAAPTSAMEQETGNEGGSIPSSEDAATGGDVVLPSGFPSDMPLPPGTAEVREDPASGGYSAYVPERDLAEVIADLETALESSGWSIVERTADIGTIGDMMFVVEGYGQEMNVFAEPLAGSEEDVHVLYFTPMFEGGSE